MNYQASGTGSGWDADQFQKRDYTIDQRCSDRHSEKRKKSCISQWNVLLRASFLWQRNFTLETMEVIFSPTTVVVSQTADPVRSFTANIFQMMLRLRFLKS